MISVAITSADIARVEVEISADGNSPSFDPIVQNLSMSQDPETGGVIAEGVIMNIPAGPGRLFTLRAFDAGDELLCSGSARADVIAGMVAVVDIVAQCGAADTGAGIVRGEFNTAPRITGLHADPSIFVHGVLAGAEVALGVVAEDADGDDITYAWSATCGSVTPADSASATWEAPDAPVACTITMTASDGRGGVTVLRLPAVTVRCPGLPQGGLGIPLSACPAWDEADEVALVFSLAGISAPPELEAGAVLRVAGSYSRGEGCDECLNSAFVYRTSDGALLMARLGRAEILDSGLPSIPPVALLTPLQASLVDVGCPADIDIVSCEEQPLAQRRAVELTRPGADTARVLDRSAGAAGDYHVFARRVLYGPDVSWCEEGTQLVNIVITRAPAGGTTDTSTCEPEGAVPYASVYISPARPYSGGWFQHDKLCQVLEHDLHGDGAELYMNCVDYVP